MKFKDADLIGVPYRITIGKKVADGVVELFDRRAKQRRCEAERGCNEGADTRDWRVTLAKLVSTAPGAVACLVTTRMQCN